MLNEDVAADAMRNDTRDDIRSMQRRSEQECKNSKLSAALRNNIRRRRDAILNSAQRSE
ncbi:hypothetical protein Sarmat_00927 [Rickettsiales endosymbiont of Paramecium tredecaurelia]|uniref:hypothetical protein n=1 Tax=Candidatus Sarmatiella mevalonica TaxID=2770581 RepID=UPI001922CBF0|nr:hypothetical protein [Candidatus Sarmatiella mevalonica]MBL3285061.1 hypothetical protein [Candidatus Sarmatiella mevalonica]